MYTYTHMHTHTCTDRHTHTHQVITHKSSSDKLSVNCSPVYYMHTYNELLNTHRHTPLPSNEYFFVFQSTVP